MRENVIRLAGGRGICGRDDADEVDQFGVEADGLAQPVEGGLGIHRDQFLLHIAQLLADLLGPLGQSRHAFFVQPGLACVLRPQLHLIPHPAQLFDGGVGLGDFAVDRLPEGELFGQRFWGCARGRVHENLEGFLQRHIPRLQAHGVPAWRGQRAGDRLFGDHIAG